MKSNSFIKAGLYRRSKTHEPVLKNGTVFVNDTKM